MMKRRSFLKGAAALVPAAGFDPGAFAGVPALDTPAEGPVIGAGKDRLGEIHSRGFSTILFKVLPRETSNGLFVIEHVNLVKGGPPLHKHLYQEEYFYVMAGEVRFAVGDQRLTLHAGESILGPRGIPHTFSAVEGKQSRMLIAFTPAGKMEEFMRATAIPNPPKDDAELFRKHDMEMVGPSPFSG